MKKLIAAIIASTAFGLGGYAQEQVQTDREAELSTKLEQANAEIDELHQQQKYKEIWRKGRYTDIGYSVASTTTDYEPTSKGKFGFFLRKGTSYLFPSKPLAGMVKVGFDVNWLDFSVNRYKSWGVKTNGGLNDYLDYDENLDPDDYIDEDDMEMADKLTNLGRWNIMIGALGIGPNVTVAPFSNFNNAARFLKVSAYFRYQPTFGIYLVSDAGELEASYAYCNMFQCGGKIMWKSIGLGIEGHWGSGKFKVLGFDDEGDDYDDVMEVAPSTPGKITRRFSNTRIYLTFTF